jgi:hypothetical protein
MNGPGLPPPPYPADEPAAIAGVEASAIIKAKVALM